MYRWGRCQRQAAGLPLERRVLVRGVRASVAGQGGRELGPGEGKRHTAGCKARGSAGDRVRAHVAEVPSGAGEHEQAVVLLPRLGLQMQGVLGQYTAHPG